MNVQGLKAGIFMLDSDVCDRRTYLDGDESKPNDHRQQLTDLGGKHTCVNCEL